MKKVIRFRGLANWRKHYCFIIFFILISVQHSTLPPDLPPSSKKKSSSASFHLREKEARLFKDLRIPSNFVSNFELPPRPRRFTRNIVIQVAAKDTKATWKEGLCRLSFAVDFGLTAVRVDETRVTSRWKDNETQKLYKGIKAGRRKARAPTRNSTESCVLCRLKKPERGRASISAVETSVQRGCVHY